MGTNLLAKLEAMLVMIPAVAVTDGPINNDEKQETFTVVPETLNDDEEMLAVGGIGNDDNERTSRQ